VFINGKCSGERFNFEMTLVLIYCTWYTSFARGENLSFFSGIF
jgi:hypothetical protein